MVPPRLALRVTRELSVAELEARLPRDEKYLTGILIRPAGTDSFGWLQAAQRVQAGDDVLLYCFSRTRSGTVTMAGPPSIPTCSRSSATSSFLRSQ